MKPGRFTVDARREFLDAVAWYEAQRPRLGSEFSEAIAEALSRILAGAATWPLVGSKGLRRYLPVSYSFHP